MGQKVFDGQGDFAIVSLDSMKINILLMMTLQSVHRRDRYYSILKTLILGLVRYHADMVNYKARKEVWTSKRVREALICSLNKAKHAYSGYRT